MTPPGFLGKMKGKKSVFWGGGEAYPDSTGTNSRKCNLDIMTIVLIESGHDSCYDFIDILCPLQNRIFMNPSKNSGGVRILSFSGFAAQAQNAVP